MQRSLRRIGFRGWTSLLVAVALAGGICLDACTGARAMSAAARYAASLLQRTGPTRDLARGLLAAGSAEQRRVRLRVWDWWSASTTEDYARYFDELERIFEQRHPEADLVFQAVPFSNFEQKLATAMQGAHPPDVFQCSVSWAPGLYNRGMLREVNDLLARTPELADEQFMPSSLFHCRQGEHIFGVPHIVDAACLIWNLEMIRAQPGLHDMFERGPDGAPDFTRIRFDAVRNWEHFRQVIQALSGRASAGAGQTGFALGAYDMGPVTFMPWAAANGVRFQDPQGTRALFDTPAGVETFAFLAGLYWTDRVCPPFQRNLTTHDLFQQGKVACTMGGTWDGKYIVRNTQGWMGFGMTAFPPGPRGTEYKTITWANMIVISSRCQDVDLAWDYVRLVCGPEGALLKLKVLNQNSPRLDFYRLDDWQEEVRQRPYLANVPRICAAGDPRHHTQPQAVQDEMQPIFEYMMLNWPDVQAGRGQYGSAADAIGLAARRVEAVFDRYNRAVADWSGAPSAKP